IRREIRMSRRLLLCPACKLREHFRCQSTTCECPYEPHIRRPAGPVEPEAMRLLAAETPGDLEPWEVECCCGATSTRGGGGRSGCCWSCADCAPSGSSGDGSARRRSGEPHRPVRRPRT